MFLYTKKHFTYFIRILPLVFLITACNPTLNITGLDISSLYTGIKGNSIQINQLYTLNDSITSVTVDLPAGLIQPDPGTKKYSKRGILKYEIIGEGKKIGLVDSATFAIADTSDNQSFISHSWTFRAPPGMNYFIKANYSVPGNQEDFLLLEFFSKNNHACRTWYRFQSISGEYLSGNTTSYAVPFRLVTEDTVTRNLQVKFYSRNFPAAFPPFAEQSRAPFLYKPDSIFNLKLENGKTPFFTPERTGFYFFQVDPASMEGPTLFRMNTGFPKVTQHALMRDALKYITSSREFQQLNSYANPKLAVDSFWIENSGRPDLATEMIRKYYQRVETANQLYTSYTEGWKTDRGMVFIVMGKPSKVFRSFEQEVWIYGEYDDTRALRFYFNKAVNPFTDNDYVLIRNQYYKTAWYQNVQMWRR